MARKVFADLNVLTAAELNTYLMDQAVQVFADAATRDAQIPSGQRKEGMQVYLQSTKEVLTYTTISGTSYWVPPVGTLVTLVQADQQYTIPSGSWQIAGLGTVIKNYDGYFQTAQNRFMPKIPGWYTFSGAVTFISNATGYRIAALRLNNASTVPGSAVQVPTTAYNMTVPIRTTSAYLNTTDSVNLNSQHNVGTDITTWFAAGYSPHLHVVYSGQ